MKAWQVREHLRLLLSMRRTFKKRQLCQLWWATNSVSVASWETSLKHTWGRTCLRKDSGKKSKAKQSVKVIFPPSHLDRVTDDYFSRDPVRNIVRISEQLLEGPMEQTALGRRKTAALCWHRHIPAGKITTHTPGPAGRYQSTSLSLFLPL